MSEIATPYSRDQNKVVIWDFVEGFIKWRLWAFLGLQDIRQRYRRSLLGPLWLTMGLGVTIAGIGLLYSQILHTAPGNYIPYLAISLLLWNFISATLVEGTLLFQGVAHVISAVSVPYTSFVLRSIVRNLIVAAHGIVVVVIAFVWFQYPVSIVALAALPGLILVCGNLYWMVLIIATISLRYRDVAQIISYAVAIALFLTPVIWMTSAVKLGSPFVNVNPFAQLLEVVRAPIFDGHVPVYSFVFDSIMMVGGTTAAIAMFIGTRRHLVYWI